MKSIKRILAGAMAAGCAFSVVGCSKDDGNTSSEESFIEQIAVEDTEEIAAIPEGANPTINWLSYFDINPAKGSAEKRTDLSLFEQKGGKINYIRTTSTKKYDDLSTGILADDKEKYPDMFWYEQRMTFPCNVVAGMFQPIDDLVDFDQPLWADVKDTAEQFSINGKHYVAPITFEIQSVLTYNQDIIDANGFDDPYDLFLKGQWNWDTFRDICAEWVALGTADNPNYGVNGWMHTHIAMSTGKTLIGFDEATNTFTNNLFDADIERAENFMYNLSKDGLYLNEWIGEASTAFQKNILFYAMGQWASIDTHTPGEDDHWSVVPMPKDPNQDTYYVSNGIVAYMWVKGSDKKDAMKTWFECARIIKTDENYKETEKQKFFLNNPNYSEKAYDLVTDELVNSTSYVRIYDPGWGISDLLSDDDHATTDSKEAIISYLYSSVSKSDAETETQFTWTQLRNSYSSQVQSELDKFNKTYAEFIANDK